MRLQVFKASLKLYITYATTSPEVAIDVPILAKSSNYNKLN